MIFHRTARINSSERSSAVPASVNYVQLKAADLYPCYSIDSEHIPSSPVTSALIVLLRLFTSSAMCSSTARHRNISSNARSDIAITRHTHR
jgi:hypothetical protein